MRDQEIIGLWEAYSQVYDLDEKSVSWDTGKNASGVSPRDAAARRQAQLQSSSNPADKVRASQVGAVRSNMRSAIQQTGTTSPNQLRSAGPIASQRFKNAAIRQRGGSPASVPIKTVPGLKDANRPKVRGGGSSAQGAGSPSGTIGYRVGAGQGYGISGIKLADEYDLYGIILSHLIEEGYAESVEQAEVIMVNMSEDWGESIVEEVEAWVNQLVEEGYDLSDYTWDEMAEIYEQNINQIEEGIGSLLLKGGKALLPKLKNIVSMFKKVELPPAKAPMSANAQRASELRAKYNIGLERSDTSPKMQILNRTKNKVDLAQQEVNRGNASNSYVNDAKAVRQRYLDAGNSKYGGNDAAGRRTLGGRGSTGTPDPSGPGSYHPSAGRPPGDRGRGGKAFAKALKLNPELTYTQYSKALYKSSKKPSMIPMALNNSYEHDLFDTILEHLVAEGYADTNESALVIMANMSEEWRQSIIEMNNLPYSDKTPTMKYDTGKPGGTMVYRTGKPTGKSVYKKGPDGRPSPYQPL